MDADALLVQGDGWPQVTTAVTPWPFVERSALRNPDPYRAPLIDLSPTLLRRAKST